MHDIVIENTMKMLFDDELIAELVDTLFEMQLRDNTVIPQLQKQLEDTQKGIENILNAIQQGVLTPSTKERLEALEETKDKLEISILQEQIKKPLLTKEQIHFWIYKFRELDYTSQAGKERLIDSFVNAVYVYGLVNCKWHFNQCTKTQAGQPFAAQTERHAKKKGGKQLQATHKKPNMKGGLIPCKTRKRTVIKLCA